MNIRFTKMHGCGNDFIVIDNRNNRLQNTEMKSFIKTICTRRFHIGANGLMLLENSSIADFSMRYFNADGSEGEMCGNGARCIAKFAYQNGVAKKVMNFETLAGLYEAKILHNGSVQVNFPPIFRHEIQLEKQLMIQETLEDYHFAVVGVPHTVIFRKEIEKETRNTFEKWARQIRCNKQLFPQGTNVNIVHVKNNQEISIRTYERGVEEETFACGSGATASAIITSLLAETSSPVNVQTKGGMLSIAFKIGDEKIERITLIGNAVTVYTGIINDF